MEGKLGRILVIRGGAVGDFILTLPAIAALRATFPRAHLEVLGYPALAELALAGGMIDGYRSIEARPLARFFARHATLDPEWSAYFESFNLIFSYLYDPDDLFKTNLGRVSQAQFVQGPHRPNESEPIHATQVFLKPLEQLAIFEADPTPRLQIHANEKMNRIAAHPGSGSEKKNWPLENWESLLKRIDSPALIVGGEAESGRLDHLRRSFPPDRLEILQNQRLAQVARVLAGCRGFVGHDSGITHLAAALGLPTIVLWGPSNDRIWAPISPLSTILKAPGGLESLSVVEVHESLQKKFGAASS